MSERRFVVAGSYKQYRLFCEERRWHHTRDATYVPENSPELRGQSPGFAVYYVGTYYERRDLDEIKDTVKALRGVER